ncbi:hypothetical protein N7495_009402 [Penicillium taxi]|uniref:uncharacterized protein n=1 Tax=Penicillium taxi TaxID=168475 RepID=UPI0025451342|nr:uncharacterized protein N7495_009402 [Penicillium taxi]KAJ5884892.1 hypothetical protein N7495_009402 [Penicillium taxi]
MRYLTQPQHSETLEVSNIQKQEDLADLQQQISDGILSSSPQLPSLLLWNDEGIALFDQFAQSPPYYLNKKELEILAHQGDDIVSRIPPDGVLIELGCGNLHKTSLILSACERQQRSVLYYALDVSIGELTENIKDLIKRMGPTQYVKVRGLLGTYDDCVAWLASDPKMVVQSSVTFLWMGNSIANLRPDDASLLLSQFSHICAKQGVRCQFIVAADACTHKPTIMAAYDTTKRPLHDFVLNGLRNANTVMGQDVFHVSDWTCAVEFNDRENVLNTYYIPRRDLQLDIDGIAAEFRKGDKVLAITSGKWIEKDVHAVSVKAGLHVVDTWRDTSSIYCFYRLQSLI